MNATRLERIGTTAIGPKIARRCRLLLLSAAGLCAAPLGHAQQLFAPVFASSPGTNAVEGEEYRYSITVLDADLLDTITIGADDLPSWLTLTDNGDRTATLSGTPSAGDTGEHDIELVASDGEHEAVQSFELTVAPKPKPPPTAQDDSYSTTEDRLLDVKRGDGVLANDSSGGDDDDNLTAALVADAAHGTLNLNGNGGFTYRPNPGFSGTDTFTYRARAQGVESNVATVTITVTARDDPPVAANDTYTTLESTPLTVGAANGVLANDTDDGAAPLTAVLTDNVDHGSLTLNADGSFAYTPAPGFAGTDSFRYRANDGTAQSNVATVTISITAVNDPPSAADDSYTTAENTPLSVNAANGVLANDTDDGGAPLTAALTDNVDHGSLTLNGDGSFTYTPQPDFVGTDSFRYRANDGTAQSNVATVAISITAVNDPPVAADDNYTTAEDAPLTVNAANGVLANDTDPDGDTLTAAIVAGAGNGTVALNANGAFTYTPPAGFNGTTSFTYRARDGNAQSNVARVNIRIEAMNDPPSFTSSPQTAVDEETAYTYRMTATDQDGDALTFAAPKLPSWLAFTPPATLAGTPPPSAVGTHDVTVTVSDGIAAPVEQTFRITVRSVDSPPEIGSIPDQTATEATPFTLDLVPFVTDADTPASSLTFAASGALPPGFALSESGTLSAPAPPAGAVGDHTVRFTVRDATSSVTGQLRLGVLRAGRADLGLTIAAAPNPVAIGATATWSLTIVNNASIAVGGMSLEASFTGDVPFRFDAPEAAGCALTPSGNTTVLACTLGALEGGATTTVTLTGSGNAAGDVFAAGSVAIAGGVPIDETPGNDAANGALGIAQAVSGTPAQEIGGVDALGAAAGDFDADGFDDLALVTATGVLLLPNGPDPADANKRALATSGLPITDQGGTAIAAADLDGDGDVDLAVAAGQGASSFVLVNDGAAAFTLVPLDGSTEDSRALAIADVNGDALPDLVFANAGAETVYLGGMSFVRAALPRSDDSRALALANVLGDSGPELVVANADGNAAVYRNGGGTFALETTLATGPTSAVMAGDFNGDGAADLLFGRTVGASADAPPADLVWLNDSTGRFFLSDQLGAAPTASLAIADLDRDGDSDAVAVAIDGAHRLYTNVGSASGTFALHPQQIARSGARRAVVGKFGADARADIAFVGANGVGVFYDDGTGQFGLGDTGAPTIQLRGEPTVTVIVSEPYTDPGATATDAADGDLTANIVADNPVDTAVIGTYTVTYTVTDSSGNAATPATRTVNVQTREAQGGGGGGAAGMLLLAALAAAAATRRCRQLSGQPLSFKSFSYVRDV